MGTLCGVLGVLLFVTGCPQPTPCTTNADCADTDTPVCDVEVGECVECLAAGDCNDADACTTDTCAADNTCDHADVDCDDDDACTTDSCAAATGCSNVPTAEAAACNDGAFCNGTETCDPATGNCEDGPVPCAAGQVCIEATDTCTLACTADAGCGDNDVCTIDSCINGGCAHVGVSCDDGDGCTTDACVSPTTGCVSTPVTCPAGQNCDPATGGCVAGCASNADCNDGNACTTDTCTNNACTNEAKLCLQGQACNPANGACETIDCTANADCNDGRSCSTDTCQLSTGRCVYTNVDAACDDGLFCTGQEGIGSCDPNNEDSEATTGCVRPGNPCGGTTPVCNEAQNDCDACATDADCDDDASCTTDNCEASGACTNTPNNSRCDDNLFCTQNDFCDPDHDDANATTGCVNINDPCEILLNVAGGFFVQRRICSEANNGECVDCTSNGECSDGITCTLDTCNGTTGICTNAGDNNECPDPDFCDGVDVCDPNNVDADSNGCVRPGDPCANPTPICDETGNDCNGCTSNTECSGFPGEDDIACTDSTCNGTTGECANTPNNTKCPVGQVCIPGFGCDLP